MRLEFRGPFFPCVSLEAFQSASSQLQTATEQTMASAQQLSAAAAPALQQVGSNAARKLEWGVEKQVVGEAGGKMEEHFRERPWSFLS